MKKIKLGELQKNNTFLKDFIEDFIESFNFCPKPCFETSLKSGQLFSYRNLKPEIPFKIDITIY